MKAQGFVKLLHVADANKESVLEMNILADEKTPWHYHTLFAETFEIVHGTLEVGKGSTMLSLAQGDSATIQPNENHYYHNTTHEACIVRVTIDHANKNFENALLILKGLANDSLASAAGTPKRFFDLVLFVYLSNSKMVGVQKLAEPLFHYFARVAIKRGRLDELLEKYCNAGDRVF